MWKIIWNSQNSIRPQRLKKAFDKSLRIVIQNTFWGRCSTSHHSSKFLDKQTQLTAVHFLFPYIQINLGHSGRMWIHFGRHKFCRLSNLFSRKIYFSRSGQNEFFLARPILRWLFSKFTYILSFCREINFYQKQIFHFLLPTPLILAPEKLSINNFCRKIKIIGMFMQFIFNVNHHEKTFTLKFIWILQQRENTVASFFSLTLSLF